MMTFEDIHFAEILGWILEYIIKETAWVLALAKYSSAEDVTSQ